MRHFLKDKPAFDQKRLAKKKKDKKKGQKVEPAFDHRDWLQEHEVLLELCTIYHLHEFEDLRLLDLAGEL